MIVNYPPVELLRLLLVGRFKVHVHVVDHQRDHGFLVLIVGLVPLRITNRDQNKQHPTDQTVLLIIALMDRMNST